MRDENEIREKLDWVDETYESGYNDIGDEPWYNTQYLTMKRTLEWVLENND